MQLATLYRSASGVSLRDCCFIGHRFAEESGFRPDAGESWVLHAAPKAAGAAEGTVTAHFGVAGWYTGLWRSGTGTVYVSDAAGKVHVQSDIAGKGRDRESWRSFDFDAVMTGVWGLSDSWVLAWGKLGGENRMYRFDGSGWARVDAPAGLVHAVHGADPESIHAAGADGLLARWNGTAWKPVAVSAKEDLTAVFAGAERGYAVGSAGGLFAGEGAKWKQIAQGPGPLQGVALFAGEVWIGAAEQGLLRLDGSGGKLEVIKPNLHVHELEAREALVMTCPGKIAGTDDGAKFSSIANGYLSSSLQDRAPLWLESESSDLA